MTGATSQLEIAAARFVGCPLRGMTAICALLPSNASSALAQSDRHSAAVGGHCAEQSEQHLWRDFAELLSCSIFSHSRLAAAGRSAPIDELGLIFAEGANALALQLPNEAAQPPLARHIEQLACRPSHLRSINAPGVEEQARRLIPLTQVPLYVVREAGRA